MKEWIIHLISITIIGNITASIVMVKKKIGGKRMNDTALRAKAQLVQVQNTNYTHMVFKDKEQELFYYQTLKQARSYDCYHKALFCVLGILKDIRRHLNQSYDEKTDYIKVGCLQKG